MVIIQNVLLAGLLVTGVATLGAPLEAASAPSPQKGNCKSPNNPIPLDYTGPSTTAHGNQVLDIYLPCTPVPVGGYPVLIDLSLANFVQTSLLGDLNLNRAEEFFVYECLTRGIAYVRCTATTFSDNVDGLGHPIPSVGIFYPPGYVLPGTTTQPYLDPTYHFAEKDAVMAVQYVRHHAGLSSGYFASINPNRIAVSGSSAGAFALSWVAYGPDRSAQTFPNPQGWEDTDTTVQAAVFTGVALALSPYAQQVAGFGTHFPRVGNETQSASTLAQVDFCVKQQASALNYVSSLSAIPRSLHVCTTPPDSLNFSMLSTPPIACCSPSGLQCADFIDNTEMDPHSAWSSLAWKTRFDAETTLFAAHSGAVFPGLTSEVYLPPAQSQNYDLSTAKAKWLALHI